MRGRCVDLVQPAGRGRARFEQCDGPRELALLAGEDGVERWHVIRQGDVALLDHRGDHPDEAEALAVLGGEDADPLLGEEGDLLGDDHAAATAVDPDVPGASALEEVSQVGEVLDVPALVRRDRDALYVLLDRGTHDRLDAAVVPEVDDLAALGLEDPAHDVDRRVMPVEQAGGGHEPDGVTRKAVLGHRAPLVRSPTSGRSVPWMTDIRISMFFTQRYPQVGPSSGRNDRIGAAPTSAAGLRPAGPRWRGSVRGRGCGSWRRGRAGCERRSRGA